MFQFICKYLKRTNLKWKEDKKRKIINSKFFFTDDGFTSSWYCFLKFILGWKLLVTHVKVPPNDIPKIPEKILIQQTCRPLHKFVSLNPNLLKYSMTAIATQAGPSLTAGAEEAWRKILGLSGWDTGKEVEKLCFWQESLPVENCWKLQNVCINFLKTNLQIWHKKDNTGIQKKMVFSEQLWTRSFTRRNLTIKMSSHWLQEKE